MIPTNLLYKVVATPGALHRNWRAGADGWSTTRLLMLGTLPGVVVGSIIRVELRPNASRFDVVIASVLIPLGAWLLFAQKLHGGGRWAAWPFDPRLAFVAALFGCVGGIYGIGGGAILAPILIGSGRPPAEVAPATLASTFVTSVAGVATFVVLSTHHHGSIALDWGVGTALGIGGLLGGGYTGARLQPRHRTKTLKPSPSDA